MPLFVEKGKDCKCLFQGALAVFLLLFVTGCSSYRSLRGTDFNALASAGLTLGIDIDRHDDARLFLASAQWIGVRYRGGGNDKNGVDCSGFVRAIYREVYGVELPRRSEEQYETAILKHRRSKSRLEQGDLVFFDSASSGGRCSHVGIYLKDGKFVHASSSRGVIVSDLESSYWRDHWLAGGSLR